MLKLMPIRLSTSIVAAKVAGTTTIATKVTRQLRRNRINTMPAKVRPMSTASRTLAADCVTSSL